MLVHLSSPYMGIDSGESSYHNVTRAGSSYINYKRECQTQCTVACSNPVFKIHLKLSHKTTVLQVQSRSNWCGASSVWTPWYWVFCHALLQHSVLCANTLLSPTTLLQCLHCTPGVALNWFSGVTVSLSLQSALPTSTSWPWVHRSLKIRDHILMAVVHQRLFSSWS